MLMNKTMKKELALDIFIKWWLRGFVELNYRNQVMIRYNAFVFLKIEEFTQKPQIKLCLCLAIRFRSFNLDLSKQFTAPFDPRPKPYTFLQFI